MKVFCGDVEIPCVKTRQRCSSMSLTRTGKLFKLTVPRPLTTESKDCLLFNTNKLSNKGKRIIRAVLKQNAHIQVVVVDKRVGVMFNRGSFTILRTLRAGRFVLHRHCENRSTNLLFPLTMGISCDVLDKFGNASMEENVVFNSSKDGFCTTSVESMTTSVESMTRALCVEKDSLQVVAPVSVDDNYANSILTAPVNNSAKKSISRSLRVLPVATLTRFMNLYYSVEFNRLSLQILHVLGTLCGEPQPLQFKDILAKLPAVRLRHADIIKSVESPNFRLVLKGLGVTIRCRSLKEWVIAHNELSCVLGAYGIYTKCKKVRDGQTFFNVYTLGIMTHMQTHLDNELHQHSLTHDEFSLGCHRNPIDAARENLETPLPGDNLEIPLFQNNLKIPLSQNNLETSLSQNGLKTSLSQNDLESMCIDNSTISIPELETGAPDLRDTITYQPKNRHLSFFDTPQNVMSHVTAFKPNNANRRRREWTALNSMPVLVSVVVQNSNCSSKIMDSVLTNAPATGVSTTGIPATLLAPTTGIPATSIPATPLAPTTGIPATPLAPTTGIPASPLAPTTGISATSQSIVSLYGKSRTHSYANNTLRCTQTEFNGTQFRSRLEARCADLMTRLGVQYLFESIKMKLDNGVWYTPDFWLPVQQIAIEIKPCYPHLEEISKCESVSRSGLFIVLMYGNPGLMPYGSEAFGRTYAHSTGLRGISWKNGNRLAGDTVWVSTIGGEIQLDQITNSTDMRWNSPEICAAIKMVPTH